MAERTLLQIATEFCNRVGLPLPTSIQNAQDDTGRQILGLLNEGIQEICDRYSLQALTTSGQFTHANGPDYGAVDLQPQTAQTVLVDWKYNDPFTLWSPTRIMVYGPATIQEWQAALRLTGIGPSYTYILYGNWLRIYPVPTNPADLFYLFYQSKYGVKADDGTTKESFTLDSDMPRIPTALMLSDLKWRWKKEKGLPYAEDQRTAEAMLVNLKGREPNPVLHLDYGDLKYGPKIFIQPGTWNL